MNLDYTNYIKIQNIIKFLTKSIGATPSVVYEINNIIERWRISENNNIQATNTMLRELKEKFSEIETSDMEKIVKQVNLIWNLDCHYQIEKVHVNYKRNKLIINDLEFRLTPKLKTLLSLTSIEKTVRCYLKYLSINSGHQQWGLVQSHYDYLYDICGVRNEGFASPMNSRLIGKVGAKFCSLFPETDEVFGSIGSFFSNHLYNQSGNWIINPPFIESIIDLMADKILTELDECLKIKKEIMCFILLPSWEDTSGFRKLIVSKFYTQRFNLKRYKFHMEDQDGNVFLSKTNCIYLVISPSPIFLDFDALSRTFS
ncbi:Phosphorylated CTD interacting factor 1 WW domain protein [uncultured archaeon]|nr:Phosphorylated CTD interacting factor 1 WW domain protein [uncultured archaeon]